MPFHSTLDLCFLPLLFFSGACSSREDRQVFWHTSSFLCINFSCLLLLDFAALCFKNMEYGETTRHGFPYGRLLVFGGMVISHRGFVHEVFFSHLFFLWLFLVDYWRI